MTSPLLPEGGAALVPSAGGGSFLSFLSRASPVAVAVSSSSTSKSNAKATAASATSAGAASASGAADNAWSDSAANDLVSQHNFAKVTMLLDAAFDEHRDPNAVDWCSATGYRRGHVFALYKSTRNYLKDAKNQVLGKTGCRDALLCASLLLLRTAQDVWSCQTNMARHGLDFVFTSLRDKVKSWLDKHPKRHWPTPASIATYIEDWQRSSKTGPLPSPVWVTAFSVSLFPGTFTFTFGNPTQDDLRSFNTHGGIGATRSDVAAAFVAFLRRQSTWEEVFSAPLASMVHRDAGAPSVSSSAGTAATIGHASYAAVAASAVTTTADKK